MVFLENNELCWAYGRPHVEGKLITAGPSQKIGFYINFETDILVMPGSFNARKIRGSLEHELLLKFQDNVRHAVCITKRWGWDRSNLFQGWTALRHLEISRDVLNSRGPWVRNLYIKAVQQGMDVTLTTPERTSELEGLIQGICSPNRLLQKC